MVNTVTALLQTFYLKVANVDVLVVSIDKR